MTKISEKAARYLSTKAVVRKKTPRAEEESPYRLAKKKRRESEAIFRL